MPHANALLLRSVDYRDSDRIVTLFTDEFGKVDAIARGARRSRKRFGGSLSSLAVLTVEFSSRGNSSLRTLTSAKIIRTFPVLLQDLNHTLIAGAGLSVLRELTEAEECDPRLFSLSVQWLESLDTTQARARELFVAMVMRVLSLLGLAPGLDACARCERRPAPGKSSLFDPKAGSIVCVSCGGGSIKLSGALRSKLALGLGPEWNHVGAFSAVERRIATSLLTSFTEHQTHRQLGAFGLAAQADGFSAQGE